MASAREPLVVDASVAVKWHLVAEDDAEQSIQMLAAYRSGSIVMHAPQHIQYEVPSALTVATRGKQPRLTIDQAR